MQPPFWLVVMALDEAKIPARTIRWNGFADRHLEMRLIGFSGSDVSAIDSNRDRPFRIGQLFPLRGAGFDEAEAFFGQFGFHPRRHSSQMPADGTRAQLIADRQHVLKKIGRDAKRCQRCPFRFQREQFRRDVVGQQLGQWAEGSGRAVVELAMVEARVRGGDIAEDGAISDLATRLAAQRSSAARAACALGAIGSALHRDDFLLQFQEQILALADRQSNFASGIGALVKNADLLV